MHSFRIGIGFDIHRLVAGRKLVLGGIEIEFARGLLGHSDGDVLLHALCDALLGAAGLGDIGDHFPDTSPRWKDVSSIQILHAVLGMVRQHGFEPNSVDCIIFAEQPKLGQLKSRIRRKLAQVLCLAETSINVKAKTMEGLGSVGSCQAIACQVIASVISDTTKL